MPTERQTRSIQTTFETRADSDGKHISGYFAVFGDVYDIADDVTETIAPGAFDGQTDGDVRALVNHMTHLVLGRTTAGTLTLRQTDRGLYGDILINEHDVDALNLYARVQRGDVNQCSFGFDILSETSELIGGKRLYTITAVKLYEVSVVTFPAYAATAVEARNADDLAARRLTAWREKLKGHLKA